MNAEEKVYNMETCETETKVVSEKSKGQIFKEKHGYSKTLSRNMRKAGVTTAMYYRELRKARKAKKRKEDRQKLEANQLWRRLHPRKKKSKGSKKPTSVATSPKA